MTKFRPSFEHVGGTNQYARSLRRAETYPPPQLAYSDNNLRIYIDEKMEATGFVRIWHALQWKLMVNNVGRDEINRFQNIVLWRLTPKAPEGSPTPFFARFSCWPSASLEGNASQCYNTERERHHRDIWALASSRTLWENNFESVLVM